MAVPQNPPSSGERASTPTSKPGSRHCTGERATRDDQKDLCITKQKKRLRPLVLEGVPRRFTATSLPPQGRRPCSYQNESGYAFHPEEKSTEGDEGTLKGENGDWVRGMLFVWTFPWWKQQDACRGEKPWSLKRVTVCSSRQKPLWH